MPCSAKTLSFYVLGERLSCALPYRALVGLSFTHSRNPASAKIGNWRPLAPDWDNDGARPLHLPAPVPAIVRDILNTIHECVRCSDTSPSLLLCSSIDRFRIVCCLAQFAEHFVLRRSRPSANDIYASSSSESPSKPGSSTSTSDEHCEIAVCVA